MLLQPVKLMKWWCCSITVDLAPTTTQPTLSTMATPAHSTPLANVQPPLKRSAPSPFLKFIWKICRRAQMCVSWGWILTRWRYSNLTQLLTSAPQIGSCCCKLLSRLFLCDSHQMCTSWCESLSSPNSCPPSNLNLVHICPRCLGLLWREEHQCRSSVATTLASICTLVNTHSILYPINCLQIQLCFFYQESNQNTKQRKNCKCCDVQCHSFKVSDHYGFSDLCFTIHKSS